MDTDKARKRLNSYIKVRVSTKEKKDLWELARLHNCATISQYVKKKLFADSCTQAKLNQILDILSKDAEVTKNVEKE